MTRADSLLQSNQALRHNRCTVSCADLDRQVGVSLRTLHRDFAPPQAQGARIEGDAGTAKGLAAAGRDESPGSYVLVSASLPKHRARERQCPPARHAILKHTSGHFGLLDSPAMPAMDRTGT